MMSETASSSSQSTPNRAKCYESLEQNPYDTANSISRSLFLWVNPFIRKGFTRNLDFDDLYKAPKENLSQELGGQLRRNWNRELEVLRNGGQPLLLRAIWRSFGFWYMMTGLWVTIGECLVRPMQGVTLGWLISDANVYLQLSTVASSPNLTSPSDADVAQAYNRVIYDAVLLTVLSCVNLICIHPYTFCTQHTGMKVRIACCHVIYRHALTLSNTALGQTTVGQMVNLLTNDVNRFDVALTYIQYLAVAPVQAIIVVSILSTMFLGLYPTLAGACLLLLYVPFQTVMGRWFGRLRQLAAGKSDERIRLMNEIVPAMRVIKMYTWEEPFASLVDVARKNEIYYIRLTSVLRAINMALFFVSSKLILFISLITFLLLGYTLEPRIVFVSITMFNAVRLLMTLFFPYGVAQMAETIISCNRLQQFLLLPQQENQKTERYVRGPAGGERLAPSQVHVECSGASANWTIQSRPLLTMDAPATSSAGAKERKKHELLGTRVPAGTQPQHLAAKRRMTGELTDPDALASLSADGSTAMSGANQTTNLTIIPALRSITYKVKAGELMIIVGRVGSGKSSVLLSILGELPLTSGKLVANGIMSYAAQEAWIFAGSVRENVVFGKPMNQERYAEVLRVCSLDRDIELLPQRDETVVGERGVSLSGGQRARINLARAIYHDADIYLLDDPLSAVDTVVAKHIFNECICGFLKSKAVILATHQTQFVRRDTRVLFLQDGNQVSCKCFSDNADLQAFIGSNWEKSDSESGPAPGTPKAPKSMAKAASIAATLAASASGGAPDTTTGSSDDSDELIEGERGIVVAPKAAQGASTVEDSSKPVSASIYWYYVRASSGYLFIGLMVASNLGTQVLFNGCDIWLSWWTDTEQRRQLNAASLNANGSLVAPEQVTITDQLTLSENSTVYSVLILCLFLLTQVRTTCFFVACMRSSIALHNRLFRSVLAAPISFFDYNPIGILLSRVSNDMGVIDDLLPPTAFDTIEIFINVIGTFVTVAVVYAFNAIPALLLCAIVIMIRLLYIRTVRSIKVIEGATRSPVYSHLATSLNGLTTIRAFKVEQEFERKFDVYQDVHTSAWFLFVAASRWLGIALDWISLGYIGSVTLIMSATVGASNSSQLGLAISSALSLSGSFQWGIRQSTELESQMTSVARIKEYSELPEEPPRESSVELPPGWPQEGAIKFEHVNLRYLSAEEPVLKDLNFSISPGERIGIVGRTGAGKSSIIAVLFRLTEPEGCIYIDGVDTKTLGLHQLRKRLSIIPQEPVLFNGTVRRNLDPFGEYQDSEIWRCLEQVKLAELIKNLPNNLNAELNEGGSNFSVGERQLICLARAVLRQNKIIVLDEATANVDPNTDKFIQKTISEMFTNCTRLTIAHRLNTIMDSDRVLVMDAGQVGEFGVPHELLQNDSGLFSTMVKNTGKNAPHLRRLAKTHHERKQQEIRRRPSRGQEGASGSSAVAQEASR